MKLPEPKAMLSWRWFMICLKVTWSGVETGRIAEIFSSFLKQLPVETAEKIETVDMDMGTA